MSPMEHASGPATLDWTRPASVAAARYEIAERALNGIAERLDGETDDGQCLQEIRLAVDLARAQLRMAGQIRRRRQPRWLARITSFSYPRERAGEGAQEPHLCFVVEITNGSKEVRGRRIEVQVPAEDAKDFGRQVEGMARTVQKGSGVR